jgi:hypothetical protein
LEEEVDRRGLGGVYEMWMKGWKKRRRKDIKGTGDLDIIDSATVGQCQSELFGSVGVGKTTFILLQKKLLEKLIQAYIAISPLQFQWPARGCSRYYSDVPSGTISDYSLFDGLYYNFALLTVESSPAQMWTPKGVQRMKPP